MHVECPDCSGTGLACGDTALHLDSCFRCGSTGKIRAPGSGQTPPLQPRDPSVGLAFVPSRASLTSSDATALATFGLEAPLGAVGAPAPTSEGEAAPPSAPARGASSDALGAPAPTSEAPSTPSNVVELFPRAANTPCASTFCRLAFGHAGLHEDRDGNRWSEAVGDPELLTLVQTAIPGDWTPRPHLVELSLDGTRDCDGIEVERRGTNVGVHLHLTVPADRAPIVLAALGRVARNGCDHRHTRGALCCLEAGHRGSHLYRCGGPLCPGLAWPETPALRHPESCRA